MLSHKTALENWKMKGVVSVALACAGLHAVASWQSEQSMQRCRVASSSGATIAAWGRLCTSIIFRIKDDPQHPFSVVGGVESPRAVGRGAKCTMRLASHAGLGTAPASTMATHLKVAMFGAFHSMRERGSNHRVTVTAQCWKVTLLVVDFVQVGCV